MVFRLRGAQISVWSTFCPSLCRTICSSQTYKFSKALFGYSMAWWCIYVLGYWIILDLVFFLVTVKQKHFTHYWPFVGRIHRSAVNSPHKDQQRGALMFSLICTWTKGWVNNQDGGGDVRCHGAHYDFTAMWYNSDITWASWDLKLLATVQQFVDADNK